jgi:hypothetical protein
MDRYSSKSAPCGGAFNFCSTGCPDFGPEPSADLIIGIASLHKSMCASARIVLTPKCRLSGLGG